MLSGFQKVGALTAPHETLHDFEQPSSPPTRSGLRRNEQVWKVLDPRLLSTAGNCARIVGQTAPVHQH